MPPQWLKPLIANPKFTDGEVRVCAAIYLSFNQKHYEQTGELLGWKTWLTLEDETAKSESTIERTFKKLERLGLLEIEHGRYDDAKKQRAENKYRATNPSPVTGCTNPSNTPRPTRQIPPDQPVTRDGIVGDSRLGERTSSSDSHSESFAETTSGAKEKEELAFDGQVLRVPVDLFRRWKKSFPHIGVRGQLQVQDDYWTNKPPLPDGELLRRVSAWLCKKNEEARRVKEKEEGS